MLQRKAIGDSVRLFRSRMTSTYEALVLTCQAGMTQGDIVMREARSLVSTNQAKTIKQKLGEFIDYWTRI